MLGGKMNVAAPETRGVITDRSLFACIGPHVDLSYRSGIYL
jgi:hypothetical protein